MIHEHSREAFHATTEVRVTRAELVVEFLTANGPATDREVCNGLGFTDMNSVRPSITTLVQDDKLHEVDSVIDAKTGRTVRRVDVGPSTVTH